MNALTVPGYTGSGGGHWQTLWEQTDPGFRRVEQRDWDRPHRKEWVSALEAAVQQSEPGLVLVAHSLGCATVAHWAGTTDRSDRVVGAMLVAPADVDAPGWPLEMAGFRPMPLKPLPFPGVVVASRDDEWVSMERARAFAEAWEIDLYDVGTRGHLDTASGVGEWAEGRRLLEGWAAAWRARR